MLGIESSDYATDRATPRLLEGWSVERAAEAGADAVKISFPFDPELDSRPIERFVTDVANESRRCQMPLFAEPLGVFHDSDHRRQVTVDAAGRFGNLGVDVLKLEFPVDVAAVGDEDVWFAACAELDAASPVPWTVLSGGEPFERFVDMVRVASDAGASGFVAGRAVWRDCVAGGKVDAAGVEQAARRLEQLIAVVEDRARPWSQHRSWTANGTERCDVTAPGFPTIDPSDRAGLLVPPTGPVRVLIDTDTANEIDDQFALTWALLSPERITVEAIVAAPYSFAHHRQGLIEATKALETATTTPVRR